MNLRSYIMEDKFKIIICDGKVNIVNYEEINAFDDTKIIVKYKKGIVLVSGNDLIISKLLDDELLVSGDILKVEFR